MVFRGWVLGVWFVIALRCEGGGCYGRGMIHTSGWYHETAYTFSCKNVCIHVFENGNARVYGLSIVLALRFVCRLD
jgi:hypothetical protein